MPRKPRNLQDGYAYKLQCDAIKAFAKNINLNKILPQPEATGIVSCWLEFIS